MKTASFILLSLACSVQLWAQKGKTYEEKCLSGDCNNGFGTYQYSNGDVYTGEFWDSEKSGYGSYIWKETDFVYQGEFKYDLIEGQGVYYFDKKQKYVGEFKNGMRHGEGMIFDKKGKVTSQGIFENDAYLGAISYYGQSADATGCLHGDCEEGYGLYRYTEGDRYFGDHANGTREGFGTYYFQNGNKYIGEWKNGAIDGFGVFYWADGAKYIGHFTQTTKNGYGVYYYSDGTKSIGVWENDVYQYSKNGMLASNDYKRCISGDCENGFGEYLFESGYYKGEWKDGYMSGKGDYIFDSGDFYTGQWSENKRNGEGIFYFTEGGRFEGGFKNQYLHGEGIRYYNDGLKQEGYWEEGSYVGTEPTANYYEVIQEIGTLDSSATEEYSKRLALVIGNSNYEGEGYLPNPVNDAKEVTKALTNAGFQVITVYNGSNKEITDAIKNFGSQLNNYTVGLFYYSGHGMQVGGVNYVIPVDAKIQDPTDVRYECVDAGRVLAKMEYAGTKVNIIILDACRNNPFIEEQRSENPTNEGLAPMDAPAGTFIAYATSPNKTASDGSGSNGLYTEELLKYLVYPDLKIEDVFKQVRIKVLEKSAGAQLPWETSSLVGDFYFIRK